MSIIYLDSLSRYGGSDGISAIPFLSKYGWYSGGNVHHRTSGSLFGDNHLQIQGGGSGKDAYWGYIYRTITTPTFGLSFKGCAITINTGSGQEFWNNFLYFAFANGNNALVMNRTYRTTSGSNNITNVDYVNSQLNGSWRGGVAFTNQLFSNVSTASNAWTSTRNVLNWFHYDFLIHTANRTLTCRVVTPDGGVYTTTMINDLPASNLTGFYLGGIGSNGQGSFLISDVVTWTADSIGLSAFPENPRKLRVQRLKPTANGSQNNWTPSSGSNFSAINETPYSDTQYTAGIGIGTKQTFLMGGLGTETNSVKSGIQGIQLNPNMIDAGGETSAVSPIQIIGGIETAMGTNITPSRVSFDNGLKIITVNPATNQPYTAAQINNAEIGFNVQ